MPTVSHCPASSGAFFVAVLHSEERAPTAGDRPDRRIVAGGLSELVAIARAEAKEDEINIGRLLGGGSRQCRRGLPE